MKRYIKITLISLCFSIVFTTCKKYEENNLWFKNPYKICPVNGYITEYKVNGDDSLLALNKYFGAPKPSDTIFYLKL